MWLEIYRRSIHRWQFSREYSPSHSPDISRNVYLTRVVPITCRCPSLTRSNHVDRQACVRFQARQRWLKPLCPTNSFFLMATSPSPLPPPPLQLTSNIPGATIITKIYKTSFFLCMYILTLQRHSSALGNASKLKHDSVTSGCWDIHWSVPEHIVLVILKVSTSCCMLLRSLQKILNNRHFAMQQ